MQRLRWEKKCFIVCLFVRKFYPKKFKFFCGDENTECRTRNFNDEVLCVKGEQIAQTAKEIGAVEKPIACKFISDRDGISEKIEALGLKVDYVGTIISDLIKDGYVPMVF